ncbi:hypothetical protein KM043_006084 [Ampulex compressa]|nr:hypothetical protein KM043_006084 [Ampulex compressa]
MPYHSRPAGSPTRPQTRNEPNLRSNPLEPPHRASWSICPLAIAVVDREARHCVRVLVSVFVSFAERKSVEPRQERLAAALATGLPEEGSALVWERASIRTRVFVI